MISKPRKKVSNGLVTEQKRKIDWKPTNECITKINSR